MIVIYLIYTFTFYINTSPSTHRQELTLITDCLKSLDLCQPPLVIFYNQGDFSNQELYQFLSRFNFQFVILGEGNNHGISRARYDMFHYILTHYPDNQYIVEAHLDMLFTPNWTSPLLSYLDTHDEPIIAPRIVYLSEGRYYALGNPAPIKFPKLIAPRIHLLESFTEDKVIECFVNPIIHKTALLKEIPFYDIGFLTGMQGFEDDSLLLAYNYLLGTRRKWLPKVCFKSCIFHQVGAQRFKLNNLSDAFEKNMNALKLQYGAYGQKELYRLHHNRSDFLNRYHHMLIAPDAYDHPITPYIPPQ